MATHTWAHTARNYFECTVCKGKANNATGEWHFGTGVHPRECPGPAAPAREARSWGKPAPSVWPTKPAPVVTIDSDVKPPSVGSWPTPKPEPKPASAWPTQKATGWPTRG